MIATAPQVAIADRQNIELADIVQRHGGDYLRAHRPRPTQVKVMRAVRRRTAARRRRTAALGGHRDHPEPSCRGIVGRVSLLF